MDLETRDKITQTHRHTRVQWGLHLAALAYIVLHVVGVVR